MKQKTALLAALACSLTGCVLSSETTTRAPTLNYQQMSMKYRHHTPIPSGSVAGAGVNCPQGYTVSGGGFDIDSTTLAIESSGPSGEALSLWPSATSPNPPSPPNSKSQPSASA